MSIFAKRPAQDFLPSFSPRCMGMPVVAVAAILAGIVFLVGCGGGTGVDPRAWKQEFTLQVREDIEATKRVGEAVRLARGPLEIQKPYEIYAGEMLVAEERLGALEPAPSYCGTAEVRALAVVGPLSYAGETFNAKNYTPVLLENAKKRPAENIEKLERALSKARC